MTLPGRSPGVGTTARRLATLAVAWIAVSALGVVGCSNATVTSVSPQARATSVVTGTATAPPASTPPASSAPSAVGLTPVRIRVPAIGVDAPLVRLGLTSTGALGVPSRAMTAGWYTGSPVPGRVGPAVIAGHIHWNGIPAVFAHLAEVGPGDRIIVSRSDGTTATFAVDRVATYAKARFPTALVYGSLDVAGLRLITCGGFNKATRTYEANVIVFATLAGA
jgi:sortase (surface protein transpeptidase)